MNTNVELAIGKCVQSFPFYQHSRVLTTVSHDWFMGGFSFATINYSAEFPKFFLFGRIFNDMKVSTFFAHLFHYHLFFEDFASTLLVNYLTKKYTSECKTKWNGIYLISMSNVHSEHVNRMSEWHYFKNNIRFFSWYFGEEKFLSFRHTHIYDYLLLFTGSVERIKLTFSVCCRVMYAWPWFSCIQMNSKIIFIWESHWNLLLRLAHFRSLYIGDKINCKQFYRQRRQKHHLFIIWLRPNYEGRYSVFSVQFL